MFIGSKHARNLLIFTGIPHVKHKHFFFLFIFQCIPSFSMREIAILEKKTMLHFRFPFSHHMLYNLTLLKILFKLLHDAGVEQTFILVQSNLYVLTSFQLLFFKWLRKLPGLKIGETEYSILCKNVPPLAGNWNNTIQISLHSWSVSNWFSVVWTNSRVLGMEKLARRKLV